MFKQGARFSPQLAALAQKCIAGSEAELENLRFLGTYILLKKNAPKQLQALVQMESLNKEQISCLLDSLVRQNVDERSEVRKLYREENKKLIEQKIEIKLESNCFNFLVVLIMKYIEAHLASVESDYQNLNILALFIQLLDKNSESF